MVASWGEPERAPHRRVECSQSIYVWYIMVRPSPARRYIHCTATRTIFRRPHEETSALSGTTCIIIAESAKQIALVSEPVSCCLEKGQVAADSDRDLGHAPAPPGIPTYLLNLFVNDLCPQCCSIAKPKCTSAQEQRERERGDCLSDERGR